MLMEQSARLEVKWYVNLILHHLSSSLAHLVQLHASRQYDTPTETAGKVLEELSNPSLPDTVYWSIARLLKYYPELVGVEQPWQATHSYGSKLSMSNIRSMQVKSLSGAVEGLPLLVGAGRSDSWWADAIAQSIRYRTRGLKSAPLVVSDRGAFASDILAVCAKYGVRKATLTSTDMGDSKKAHGALVEAWLQDSLDGIEEAPSLLAFMHLLANPMEYSLGGNRVLAGKQTLIASYAQNGSLSAEEEAAGYVKSIQAMETYSHPLGDTVLSARAEACVVTRGFYEDVMSYGVDKVNEVLADVQDLYQAMPAVSLAGPIGKVRKSSRYGTTVAYPVSTAESAALMLAIAADPAIASLMVLTEGDGSHPLISNFLRMAMQEGSERALSVAHAALRLLGMEGQLADLSVLAGKETSLEAVTAAGAGVLAEYCPEEEE